MHVVNDYWFHKTRVGRKDVYFGGVRSLGRMGGLYSMNLQIFDPAEKNSKPLLIYNYHHLVVDDHSSYCIPYVERGDNWYVLFIAF